MLRNDNHRRSKLQERRAAKDYGGSVVPGSGNQWHSKGDVITEEWLIECKVTTKQSYSLKKETWKKIEQEAILASRLPAMEIDLDGRPLVVIDKDDFLELAGLA